MSDWHGERGQRAVRGSAGGRSCSRYNNKVNSERHTELFIVYLTHADHKDGAPRLAGS